MDNINKLLEKREGRLDRTQSIQALYEKINRAKMVLHFVQSAPNNSKGRRMKSEARKQFIISLVTAFETYTGDLVVELIDNNRVNLNPKLLEGISAKYNIKEINDIIKNKLTIGELICDNLNFQRLDSTFEYLSRLFNRNFPKVLEENKFQFKNTKGNIVTITLRKGFIKNLESIFRLRHQFVHEISFKNTPSYDKTKLYSRLMKNLATCIDVLADSLRNSTITDSKLKKK